MSRFMVEMFQDRACTDSMGRSEGPCGNFQYLTERADGVSGHLGGLIRTCVSHHDDPQRVAPTGVAVGRKYTEDTFGDRVSLIPRWYDNTNSLDPRRCKKYLVVCESVRSIGMLHRYS